MAEPQNPPSTPKNNSNTNDALEDFEKHMEEQNKKSLSSYFKKDAKEEEKIEKEREEFQEKEEKEEKKESWKRTKWLYRKGKEGVHAAYKNASVVGFFIILSGLVHFGDAYFFGFGNPFWRGIVYFILFFLTLFLFNGALFAFIVALLAWGTPPFLLFITKNGYIGGIIAVMCPIYWILMMFLMPPEQEAKDYLFKIAKVAYVLALIYVFVTLLLFPLLAMAGVSQEDVKNSLVAATTTKGGGVEVAQNAANAVIKGTVVEIPKAIGNFWNQQINIATGGDYYSGQVEQNKREPIGVYIENFRAADPTLYEDQTITLWATLKARTILDKDITISPACQASDQYRTLVKGKINNDENPKYSVSGYEEADLQCDFQPNSLSKGQHQANLTALFNFDTFSYMKAHFMERQRLLELKRQGIDPLTQYKITDKNPVAVFTNGPVGIGMDLPDMPIGLTNQEKIDGNTVVLPTLGVTIENRWEGRIKKIKRILLYVPAGITLESCDHPFMQAKDLAPEDVQEGYTAFTLANPNDPITTEIANQATGTYRTFKCRIKTISDPADILGAAPIITKNFKLTISYDYELVKSISLDVKEGIGGSFIPVKSAVTVPQTPSGTDIENFQNLFDTTKYNDRPYTEILQSSPGGKTVHELIAAIIVVETGVQNVDASQTKRPGCTGISQMCGGLASKLHLCDSASCKGFDYRMQVDRHINALGSQISALQTAFTTPLNYDDKEKFAIAAYIAGSEQVIKEAISAAVTSSQTQGQGSAAQTSIKWEAVAPFITKELLAKFPDYQGLSDDERNKKAEEIKNYVPLVINYRDKFHEKGSFN